MSYFKKLKFMLSVQPSYFSCFYIFSLWVIDKTAFLDLFQVEWDFRDKLNSKWRM